jgi:hypothetical protein
MPTDLLLSACYAPPDTTTALVLSAYSGPPELTIALL